MKRSGICQLVVIALLVTACRADTSTGAPSATPTSGEPTTSATSEPPVIGEPIRVGIITSTSGPLQTYGQQYLAGLEAGLAWATDGTGAVKGRPIEFVISDDGGVPETAISQATDLVGQGVTVIAGTVVSGVAVQLAAFAAENNILYISGPAATDAITGVNRNTFRSGRQSRQDVATAASLVQGDGGTILVFAQDTAFGAANVAAVKGVLGPRGYTVDSLLVPESETEFTAFADRINQAAPDLVFVAWAGATSGAMWQALNQQRVFDTAPVVTELGDTATWPFYGAAATRLNFASHYFAGAPNNPVNDYLVANAKIVDLFTPDGFVAAQMIVRALSEADPTDVSRMILDTEEWMFEAPKGTQIIRSSDHAMLQPMFVVRLVDNSGRLEAQLVKTVSLEDTAPPEP